jgi:monofunctional biosynthetic peptidoglycan transglycosylase
MKRRRSLVSRIGRGAAALVVFVLLACIVPVLAFRWLPVPFTAFMLQDRVNAALSRQHDYRFRHDWVPWKQISPNAARAVIASEDQKFASHHGFDLESIDQALAEKDRGRRLRGASTISQQLAKNLFLWPGRSWVRKGLEAWFTLLLEGLWPKQRILEVYLNSAEFGRGVWGIEAASQRFFGKPARRLSRGEAALLAAVLPSPRRLHADAASPYLRSRQAWILDQMDAVSLPGT